MKRLQQTGQALGSNALLTLVLADSADADKLFCALWEKINLFEQKFSRFLPGSELSKFNRQAGKTVVISPEFKQLLEVSKLMSQKTSGTFNLFILPSLQKAGYLNSWVKSTSDGVPDLFQNKNLVSSMRLNINHNSAKIPANSALDLGGIGKGWLLDRLSKYLERQDIKHYWLSLGGDIICEGNDIDGQPWQVAVANAISPESNIEQISNRGRRLAIATSGTVKRQGVYSGKRWHHLIDPKTNEPAVTDILTATVCAKTAVAADVAAKCLIIGGQKKMKNIARVLQIDFMLLQSKMADDSKKSVRIVKKHFVRRNQ